MTTTNRRSRFWHRLFDAAGERAPPPAPPLFQPRPVPQPPPKGPGLPEWSDILSAAPPVSDAVADLIPVAEHTGGVLLNWPTKRLPTEDEQRLLLRIETMLGTGDIVQAAAELDAELRERPEVSDGQGRPLYLLESLKVALLLDAADAAADRARRLRPHLAPDDPVVDVLYARAALSAGNPAAARAHWGAALARRDDLAEARDWLAAHPVSPEGGILARELLGPGGAAPLGRILPPLPISLAPAEPTALPDWLPATLLTGVTLSVDHDGGIVTEVSGSGDGPAGAMATDLALVLRHPNGIGRPHAFAELLLAAFVVQRQLLGHLRPARIYVGRESWARPGQPPAVQIEMLTALFPGLRVVGEHDPVREPNVLVVDGAARNAATGTLIGGMMPWVLQWTQDARARAHAFCDLPHTAEPPRAPGRRPRVLYLNAPPPRALAEPVRDRLFGLFTAAGYEVALADMSATSWQRQVQLAYGADIITGVHGPAMDLVLWAHPETRVLEFFPEGARRYDGQLLAEAANVAYLGLEGVAERGFVIHARERWGPPVGRANRLVWALPWSMLEQALAVPKTG